MCVCVCVCVCVCLYEYLFHARDVWSFVYVFICDDVCICDDLTQTVSNDLSKPSQHEE